MKDKILDRNIILKLLKFTKSYRHWFFLAIAALIMSTAAELSLPVVLQRTIDRHIMSHWTWMSRETAETFDLLEKNEFYGAGGKVFLREGDIHGITVSEKNSLIASDDLSDEIWFLFPLNEETSAVLDGSSYLSLDGGRGAIPFSELNVLDSQSYRLLRSENIGGLGRSTLLYFILLFAILIFSFVQIYTMSWTSQGVMKDIRMSMLDHVMRQSLSYLGDTPVGSLLSRITSDVETINEFFTSVTISLLSDFAIMGGVLITLFILNPFLALITVLTLPPVLIGTLIFRRLARSAYRRQRHWTSRVNSFLSEHVSGMDIIQIYGREKTTADEFAGTNEELFKASLSEMYVFAVFRPLVNLLTSVTLGIVIYTGARMLDRNVLSLGVLIAFIELIQKFYRPVMDLSEKFSIMQSAMAGGERVFALLENDHSIPDTGDHRLEKSIRGELEFRNVNFSYRPGEPVISDLSFHAAPGETIAIVGYTGSGKTTIASLAARFWDIDSGEILLDGTPLKDYRLKDLRQSIQSVQQDVFLFSGSIRENITLGMNMDDERIVAAARTVQADRFIASMEKGYATILQEKGKNLSGGQKQLLSFTRAIAHNPSVLILDEATAAIDTETEKMIQQALDKLLEGRTSLVIAHRISTIRKADRILVLSEGKLVESGNHDELIERKGLYYNLYRYQYASSEAVGI